MHIKLSTKIVSTIVLVLGYPLFLALALLEETVEFTGRGVHMLYRMWTE